jgi:hypothetical protein
MGSYSHFSAIPAAGGMLPIMKVLATLLLVCAACGGDDVELYPVNPGGGGPSGGLTQPDASEGDGDSGVEITGRVCLLVDARTPTSGCADTGADGLTVTLGPRMAMTTANGSFTIRVLTGTNNVWRVTGTTIVSSAMTVGASTVIPALSANVYGDMVVTNNANFVDTGAIIAKLTNNNAPVVNATVTVEPAAATSPRYDGADEITWDPNTTGALGVAWVPGITPRNAESLTVTAQQDTKILDNIPVFANTITWLFVNVP